MSKIYKCENCKAYTLNEICKKCSKKTINSSYKFKKVRDAPKSN